ncbi:hypothetical protein IWQ60_001920 [Tieghemiomyces parasiticus]|uniref:Arrestin-like N-terminal domain-containing protein n=1 Tax=Tieghemiomyces parasiticus TaxID=78921 RepID=A0A9W8AKC7_9FUNG|nr:hypothetical protein IWQ60_001920 [Tieghemiomyces parasiticus]
MSQAQSVEVSLAYNPDYVYHSNEVITGVVKFKTSVPISPSRIILCFAGHEKVSLTISAGSPRCLDKVYYEQELVVWTDKMSGNEQVIMPGTHCFPFSCQLPAMNYPGSTCRIESADTTCPDFTIHYYFQALAEFGDEKLYSVAASILYEPVLWPTTALDGRVRATATPETLFAQESMVDIDGRESSYTVRACFNQREYRVGEEVRVELEVSHKSGSVRVMHALCTLEETTECHLDGRAHAGAPSHQAVWSYRTNLGMDYPEPLDLPKPVVATSPMKARRRAISNAANHLLAKRNPSLDLSHPTASIDGETLNAFASSAAVTDRPYRCMAKIKLPTHLRPLSAAHLSFQYRLTVDLKVPNGLFKRKSLKCVRATFPIRIVTVNRQVAEMVRAVRRSQEQSAPRMKLSDGTTVPMYFCHLPAVLQTPMVMDQGLDYSELDREQPYLTYADDLNSLWIPAPSAKVIDLPKSIVDINDASANQRERAGSYSSSETCVDLKYYMLGHNANESMDVDYNDYRLCSVG